MAHSYTVDKFLKVPTEWHPPRKDNEGNWVCPRDDLLPGCAIQCSTWLAEYNVCKLLIFRCYLIIRRALQELLRELTTKEIAKLSMRNSACVKIIV